MAEPTTEEIAKAATVSKLDALTFQRLHPRAYLERFLAEGVRPDGREPNKWRELQLNVGSISTAQGSALVRLGQTSVVCGVKAEIAEPDLDRPEHGFIVPNIDLPALCSPKFKPGPPTEEAQVLSERLNSIMVSAEVVPTSSLCIHPGKAVWVLYLDIICINYDGNALDAAVLSAIAALQNTRLPKPTHNEDTGQTTCSRTETVSLQLKSIPLASTFGIFDSKHILFDPSSFEEPLLETSVVVVTDEAGRIVNVQQRGLGLKGNQHVILECIKAAKTRHTEVTKTLRST